MKTKEQTYDIIAKFLSGESSREEDVLLNDWLKEDENQKQFQEIKDTWISNFGSERYGANKAWEKVSGELLEEDHTKGSKNKIWPYLVAASLLLVSLLVYIPKNMELPIQAYSTLNETRQFKLEDGSTVFLNKNSSLQFTMNGEEGKRVAILVGEGFFDVQRNEEMPFIVQTQSATVEVLGTSFNVLSSKNTGETSVLVATGKVKVVNQQTYKEVFIEKDQGAHVLNNTLEVLPEYDHNKFAWRTHKLVFQFTPLPKALKTVSELFGVEVILELPNSEECVTNSSFEQATFDEIIKSFCTAFKLEQSFENDSVILRGKGCGS